MINQIRAVFFKEMKSILRDRRSFVISLIIPILLVPLMLIIMDFAMTKNNGNVINVARIAISRKDNSFYDFCAAQDENLIIVDVDDKDKAFASGEIHAYAEVGENLDTNILNNEPLSLEIDYNEKSLNAMTAKAVIAYYENTYRYNAENRDGDLNFSSVGEIRATFDAKIKPFDIKDQGVSMDSIDFMGICFNMLIPMTVLLYCYYGSIGTANELTVGEKERGTLEPLLSTSARRSAIIIGKLFTTTTMGIIASLSTIFGFCFSLFFSSKTKFSLTLQEFLMLFTIILFSSMFFSAVNMVIGIISRSSKEAQTYFTPITFLFALPSFFTYTLEINQIKQIYLSIPIFNIVCVIKEIFSHVVIPMHFAITLGWLVLYTIISFIFAFKIFKRENVIFRS